MKKRRITRLISLLTVCAITFSIPVYSTTIDSVEIGSKISDDLQEVMNSSSDTDLVDIYYTIKTLDIDSLKNKLSSIYNFDYDKYQDPETCKEMLVPVVLTELKASSLYNSAFKEISFDDYKTMKAGDSNVNFALLDKINEWVGQKVDLYRKAKVEVYKEYYDSVRDYIKNKYKGESYEEIERFGIVSATRARATKAVISKLEQELIVESIYLHIDVKVENDTSVASTQIGADSSTGTKSILYSSPYNGNNVKIGVIEGVSVDETGIRTGRFNITNKQLQTAISANRLIYVQNGNIHPAMDDHATLVVTEIIGSQASVVAPDNRIHTFEGIVPSSFVYQTNFDSWDSLLSAINLLIEDYNVSIINMSAHVGNSINNREIENIGNYDIYDNEIDKIVRDQGITFIKTSGNNSYDNYKYINRPAKGLNVITVGSLSTKSSIFPSRAELLSTQFPVANYSCYMHSDTLPQKPDISAPGNYITGVKDNSGNLIYDDEYNNNVLDGGTSFAAPLVTGVAAQIIQADPTLRFNGLAVKAIILGGANKDAVDTTYSIENHLSTSAGVGMVDSVNSVERADAQTVFSNSFSITSSGCSTSYRYRDIQLTAGKTVRIVMTYNKIYDEIYTEGYPNKLNFQLYYNRPEGNSFYRQLVASSHTYSFNNVKVIECVVPETGSYSIRVALGPGYEKPTSGTVYQQYAVSYGYK